MNWVRFPEWNPVLLSQQLLQKINIKYNLQMHLSPFACYCVPFQFNLAITVTLNRCTLPLRKNKKNSKLTSLNFCLINLKRFFLFLQCIEPFIYTVLFFSAFIHRFHKWRTHGKKLVPSHENEAFQDKQLSCNKRFGRICAFLQSFEDIFH